MMNNRVHCIAIIIFTLTTICEMNFSYFVNGWTFQIEIWFRVDSFWYSAGEVEGDDWSVIMAENVVIHQAVGLSRRKKPKTLWWRRPTVGSTWWCDGWRRRGRGCELRQPPITEALQAAAAAGRRRCRRRIRTQRAVEYSVNCAMDRCYETS